MRRALAVTAVLALGGAGCGDAARRPSASTAPAAAAPGAAATPASAPVTKKSPDSDAPATAPAHWLPPAAWVYNHWLPYDEARLYGLLKITRQQLWAQLRDDHRTLAQLAARHGYPDPRVLARDLVAPRAAAVGPQRAGELRHRALQTITQGHLAQHVFFHSLHQFAVPSAAPDIFGVTDARFRALRRQELSPLSIGRLHGRSPGAVEGASIAVLRERVRTGVRGGAMSRAQGDLLLRRQLTQLPRWLDQARYNGPPPTHAGNLVDLPKDYASNPAIAASGRFVAYEAYRQKLPLAVKLGEIAVLRTDLATGRTRLVSPIPAGGRNPTSAYNPSISSDGRRVTFESSAGNNNFAKRYGRIGTLLADTRTGTVGPVARPRRGVPDSQSTYNPDVAAGGRRMVYQAVRDGRTVVIARSLPGGAERVVVRGAKAGGERYADPYEATLSADGSKLVYTLASGRVDDPRTATSSVRVTDLRSGRSVVASRSDGRAGRPLGGFSADPAISPDGRFVAFTQETGRTRLLLRDLASGRTRAIPVDGGRPLDPVVANGGRAVAFTVVDGATAQVMTWSARSGRVTVASVRRGTAGAAADGYSADPSLSADGRRVAFASTAKDLVAAAGDGTRQVYVRDLRTGRTRKVSDVEVAYAGRRLPPGFTPPKLATVPAPSATAVAADAADADDTVFVTDNAFVDGVQRPTVRVAPGTLVTWRWRSRQSHSVQLRSGPVTFASRVRQEGAYRHRFEQPGTYELVCSLHAPGMKMQVVVGDA